jgi:hypothetical protein
MHNPFSEPNLKLRSCYPTPQQQLLLQAALWQGEPAIEAWKKWQINTKLETLDPGSYRMLPLLYHNLSVHGIEHPTLSKMKGVYRHTWAQNQLLLYRITQVLIALQEAEIPTLLLKGAALITLYYQNQGLRPMSDFDLLVPKAKIPQAIDILQALEWLPETIPDFSNHHAHTFKNQGQELDLHWSFIPESIAHPQAEDIWQRAIPCPLPALALSPTDQLFHICVHGFQWNPMPSLRWVADAIVLLKHQPQLDWNRLIDLAICYELVLPLKVG